MLAVVVSCKNGGSSAGAEEVGIPTDSIYCRDPFIVADKVTGTYYLFRSSGCRQKHAREHYPKPPSHPNG